MSSTQAELARPVRLPSHSPKPWGVWSHHPSLTTCPQERQSPRLTDCGLTLCDISRTRKSETVICAQGTPSPCASFQKIRLSDKANRSENTPQTPRPDLGISESERLPTSLTQRQCGTYRAGKVLALCLAGEARRGSYSRLKKEKLLSSSMCQWPC